MVQRTCGWNATAVNVSANNTKLTQGKDYSVGVVPALHENKMTLFIYTNSTREFNIVLPIEMM